MENYIRIYKQSECIAFHKTKDEFGGLSNMASGFPLFVNRFPIRTSEALYQACRFPHLPDIQRRIIDAKSPMTAKMLSKPYRKYSREDWICVRVKIMQWCLRIKLAQNLEKFSSLLLSTKELAIVEYSTKDDFWGAKFDKEKGCFIGMNVLGRLLMGLRLELQEKKLNELAYVKPLEIGNFLLFNEEINPVKENKKTVENNFKTSHQQSWLSLL